MEKEKEKRKLMERKRRGEGKSQGEAEAEEERSPWGIRVAKDLRTDVINSLVGCFLLSPKQVYYEEFNEMTSRMYTNTPKCRQKLIED